MYLEVSERERFMNQKLNSENTMTENFEKMNVPIDHHQSIGNQQSKSKSI